jgi:beta-lactamase class A
MSPHERGAAMTDDTAQAEAAAQRLIEGFAGEAAFFARNLRTGAEIGHAPDRVMPTASTIKLLVLAEFFRQVAAGLVDVNAPLPIATEDRRGGSGILKDLAPDLLLSARDHATLMTALSDNISTAVLVRLLGREQILKSGRDWGLTATCATFAGQEREYGSSTPRDLVRLLTLIGTDTLDSRATSAAIRDVLVTQQYHEQLGRYLPYSQYARQGAEHSGPVIIRSKSGFSSGPTGGVRADVGLIDAPGGVRYAICTMTAGSPDKGFGPEHPGAILNGRLSRLVFDAWCGDDT